MYKPPIVKTPKEESLWRNIYTTNSRKPSNQYVPIVRRFEYTLNELNKCLNVVDISRLCLSYLTPDFDLRQLFNDFAKRYAREEKRFRPDYENNDFNFQPSYTTVALGKRLWLNLTSGDHSDLNGDYRFLVFNDSTDRCIPSVYDTLLRFFEPRFRDIPQLNQRQLIMMIQSQAEILFTYITELRNMRTSGVPIFAVDMTHFKNHRMRVFCSKECEEEEDVCYTVPIIEHISITQHTGKQPFEIMCYAPGCSNHFTPEEICIDSFVSIHTFCSNACYQIAKEHMSRPELGLHPQLIQLVHSAPQSFQRIFQSGTTARKCRDYVAMLEKKQECEESDSDCDSYIVSDDDCLDDFCDESFDYIWSIEDFSYADDHNRSDVYGCKYCSKLDCDESCESECDDVDKKDTISIRRTRKLATKRTSRVVKLKKKATKSKERVAKKRMSKYESKQMKRARFYIEINQ
jgi:hypothetical protein